MARPPHAELTRDGRGRAAAVTFPPAPSSTRIGGAACTSSVVAFRFLGTRVLGLPTSGHRDFEEMNLRFYVRRENGGETRRAVVFIRELVPRRAIAAVARAIYNEPYTALPMRSRGGRRLRRPGGVEYAWSLGGRWHTLAARAEGPGGAVPAAGSQEEFITEHYWGYTRQRDGTTVEIHEVRHPRWRVWEGTGAALDCDAGQVYGGRRSWRHSRRIPARPSWPTGARGDRLPGRRGCPRISGSTGLPRVSEPNIPCSSSPGPACEEEHVCRTRKPRSRCQTGSAHSPSMAIGIPSRECSGPQNLGELAVSWPVVVEGVDQSVAEVADEQVAAELAEVVGRQRQAPRRVELLARRDAAAASGRRCRTR